MRLTEIYTSVQGEGPRTGVPTQFVRFAGCNLRCPGWPCDTPFAIFPEEYRHTWKKVEPDDLVRKIQAEAYERGATNICLTGGEPFIQQDEELEVVVDELLVAGYQVECFSNGTVEYPLWAANQISFVMDWKLPGSGEDHLDETRIKNIEILRNGYRRHAVKFVLKGIHDFTLARDLYKKHLAKTGLEVFFGRVWDSPITDAYWVDQVLEHKLPWRLNVQLHNYIWPPHERAR